MEPTDDFPVFLIPIIFMIVFPLFWIGIVYLISFLGGWARLAQYYQTTTPFTGQMWHMQSGQIGWSNYNGTLTTGASEAYLYLAVLFLFRPGHPPLLIPWYDVTTKESKLLWMRMVTFTFSRAPGVRVKIRAHQAAKLLEIRPGDKQFV